MVITKIAQGIISYGLRYGKNFIRQENNIWKTAQPFTSRRIGIRHGIVVGEAISELIRNSSYNPEVAVPPIQFKYPSSSTNQARYRRGGFRNKYNFKCKPRKGRGRSSFRKSYSSRNRF